MVNRMTSKEIIQLLTREGWYLVHVVGSHHQFKHPSRLGKVTVPHPKKDLPLPTVRSILKQAGLR
jgi:predicted RNA binding protein YcfA (HicA-like mRNA interferase family)